MLANPELRERLSGEALEPMPMTPEQFGQYIATTSPSGRSSRRTATSR